MPAHRRHPPTARGRSRETRASTRATPQPGVVSHALPPLGPASTTARHSQRLPREVSYRPRRPACRGAASPEVPSRERRTTPRHRPTLRRARRRRDRPPRELLRVQWQQRRHDAVLTDESQTPHPARCLPRHVSRIVVRRAPHDFTACSRLRRVIAYRPRRCLSDSPLSHGWRRCVVAPFLRSSARERSCVSRG